MKKYITTDKHPYWKEGIILKYDYTLQMYIDESGWCQWHKSIPKNCYALTEGLIKEIQEPKWTDEDVKEIVYDIYGGSKDVVYDRVEKQLKVWEKIRS